MVLALLSGLLKLVSTKLGLCLLILAAIAVFVFGHRPEPCPPHICHDPNSYESLRYKANAMPKFETKAELDAYADRLRCRRSHELREVYADEGIRWRPLPENYEQCKRAGMPAPRGTA